MIELHPETNRLLIQIGTPEPSLPLFWTGATHACVSSIRGSFEASIITSAESAAYALSNYHYLQRTASVAQYIAYQCVETQRGTWQINPKTKIKRSFNIESIFTTCVACNADFSLPGSADIEWSKAPRSMGRVIQSVLLNLRLYGTL